MKKPPKIVIRGVWRDTIRFASHIFYRRKVFRRSTIKRPVEGYIADLSAALHPEVQKLVITGIRRESPTVQTYRLTPASGEMIAPFRAGQYISVSVKLEYSHTISRPYSICNTPDNAYRDNTYEITIKTDPTSFIPLAISKTWKMDTGVEVSGPEGFFSYEPLRDPPHLVCLAGGSGITPFRSMIGETISRRPNVTITLVQGAAALEELLYNNEFQVLADKHPDRFKRIVVLSDEPDSEENLEKSYRRGFINSDILTEALGGKESAVFICGPQGMHRHVDKELRRSDIYPKRVRREDYGIPGGPSDKTAVTLTVILPGGEKNIPADTNETILVAMERAEMRPPSRCRTGSCGWCRTALKSGKIRYENEPAGLRSADKKLGYFHPCAAKPETDLIIEIPRNPGVTVAAEV